MEYFVHALRLRGQKENNAPRDMKRLCQLYIQWEKVWWSALDIIKYYNGLSKKIWKDICHF